MKKCLIGWVIVFTLPALGLAAYKYNSIKRLFESKTVDKTVSFAVFKENNYRAAVYNHTYAEIHIGIEKVRGSIRTPVWDTTFDAKLLRQYPSIENALSRKITIDNMVDKKEHLEINYVVTYNSKGSILQMQGGSLVADSCGKLRIGI